MREIPPEEANELLKQRDDEGFTSLFNGKDLTGWTGKVENYEVTGDGTIRCQPHKGGTLYTEEEFDDFIVKLEFKLPKAGNNGLAIRYPGKGDPAYSGMTELQVLDTPGYPGQLDPRQAHGSVYGMVAAATGYLRPAGQWNYQEVTVKGSTIKVELNGTVILDTDLAEVTEFMGGHPHPGKDLTKGHFGFAGHSDPVEFRDDRDQAAPLSRRVNDPSEASAASIVWWTSSSAQRACSATAERRTSTTTSCHSSGLPEIAFERAAARQLLRSLSRVFRPPLVDLATQSVYHVGIELRAIDRLVRICQQVIQLGHYRDVTVHVAIPVQLTVAMQQ